MDQATVTSSIATSQPDHGGAADVRVELREAFQRLHTASRRDPYPSYEQRIARLDALLRITLKHQREIAEEIGKDFGHRSPHETQLGETFPMVTLLRYLKRNLRRFMKPRSRNVPLVMRPARAKVHLQPLGVVGVISPWNYPYQLALAPVATALAAGNRVMLKPSELTPRTSELMKRLLSETFDADTVVVVTGEADVAAAFSELPFDHLLFTGSTHVGRLVAQAAAKNLTPVTLELGGKSPALLHESFPIDKAAERIAVGKWFNAGQTCIAPDYVFVPRAQLDPLVEQVRAAVARLYPTLADNPDYTSVVNQRHYDRLVGLMQDAEHAGARKIECNPRGEPLPAETRKIAPTVLLDVDDSMRVMQEEIFGPLLPIKPYDDIGEAMEYIGAHPRPLAFYYFDYDDDRSRKVLEQTAVGGATINDTLLHFVQEDLPFGGIGPSGIGAYHGPEGFETFSHKKGVFYQSRLNAAALTMPPYGEKVDRLMRLLLGKG